MSGQECIRSIIVRLVIAVAPGAGFIPAIQADNLVIRGRVLDTDEQAVNQAQVTLQQFGGAGPSAITVFTDETGRFAFPDPPANAGSVELTVRSLGFDIRQTTLAPGETDLRLVLEPVSNQAGVAPDLKGRIWFSDIHNNAIGYLDPETGESETIDVPEVPQRTFGMRPYGMVMASNREHVWYTQLGIGTFGSFNTTTMEFETLVQLADADAGPRRIAIDENDVIYIPLFGAGQLIEYDTRTRKQPGIYDLPDRASAPYAAVWDPGRQVAWIVTANADAIYRFDPASKAFGVLPLPREQAYLRGLQVDPETGLLATSYANLPKRSHGPRMALLIDPGDGYGQGKQITPGDDR